MERFVLKSNRLLLLFLNCSVNIIDGTFQDIKTLQEVYGKVNKNCKIDLNRRPTNVDQTNFSSPTAGSSSVLPCTSALVMTSPSKILYKELFGSDCESSSCDEDASPLPSTSGSTELKRLKLPKTKQQKSGHNNVKGKQIKMCQPQPKKTKAIKKISGNRNGNWPEYWDFFLWKPSNREQVAPVHFFKHVNNQFILTPTEVKCYLLRIFYSGIGSLCE